MKSIYTYYKERLIEISGKNRSLYLKNFNKKNGYDVGKILYSMPEKTEELLDLLWKGKSLPFKLICKETKDSIWAANKVNEKYPDQTFNDDKERQKYLKLKKEYSKKVYEQEVISLKSLKREISEIEKETGRYELFLCYPFVYGSVKNYTFKAPLLMFPIVIDVIDDNNLNIFFKYGDKIQLNKALMLAIADSQRLNLQDMDMEFDNLESKFKDIPALLNYLKSFGIKIQFEPRKNIFAYNRYSEPTYKDKMEIKHLCLLSRCSLANSIYSDYSALEKKHLTNDSINELLNIKTHKPKPSKFNNLYLINNVDYAQEQVVKKVNENGNMVIYGPPGTGKSQTIVNIISDSISKNKQVLVVSQKRAALDVVYNRLSTLNSKAMFLINSEKEKRLFYERCFEAHQKIINTSYDCNLEKDLENIVKQIEVECKKLESISNCLNKTTDFGISLQDMYYNSYKIGKETFEYNIYKAMLKNKNLMSLKYLDLTKALSFLNEKNKSELYYNFVEDKKKNPFIDHLKDDLSVHTITNAQTKLKNLLSERQALFDIAKYKYSRHILTYYSQVKNKKNLKSLVKLVSKFEHQKLDKLLKVSCIIFPLYPFFKYKMNKKQQEINIQFNQTTKAIDDYICDFDFLKKVLTPSGYLMAIDGILNGNNTILKLLLFAVDNYVKLKDINLIIKNLDDQQKTILNFAYKNTTTYAKYKEVLNKILPIRLYHEISQYESTKQIELSSIVDFENIKARISSLKKQQNNLSKKISEQSFNEEYKKLIDNSITCKDYIYQISKKQNFWPIRKTIEIYGKYLFKLFPCWLLSPENVSTILPLKKNLFDIVLFDEASQVFIENTIPSIFRGKNIVVAGDSKQLRPTTTFMKRYMGANVDDDHDYSKQAALEVESLLDLAVSRFNSANITYHYRSKHQELIDFSNKAFYNGSLQISPNINKKIRKKPIERILVNGIWNDRKNIEEAKQVVELLKRILKNRKNNETIGIITFNVEQEACIEDLIENECKNDISFRNLIFKEQNRIENGQDVSMFVKNLENVQGDERDIIIFSIGYAKNELGKVNYTFGSLSMEGGENRLNVAITRSKSKIYVVTSIEPEELKVENSKFPGPRLLKLYLSYVRAVSSDNKEEIKSILNSFNENTFTAKNFSNILPIEQQLANNLLKLGFKVDFDIGNSNSKIPLAVYDKTLNKYLLGIETDQSVINSSPHTLERDVYRYEFLNSKGWKLYRVWSRDWWHNPNQVINNIVKEIEKQKKYN